MTNVLFAHRQRASFIGHELWIAQRTDGKWQIWIEGRRPLHQETSFFQDQNEAKNMVHSLAHRHLEAKEICDCKTDLHWETAGPETRRAVKRFNYPCEISLDDNGIMSIGCIGNLSTDGAFIQTRNPPVEGSLLGLSFRVGHVVIETQGEVVHRHPNQGMGVRFLNLDTTGRRIISRLADQESANQQENKPLDTPSSQ